MYGSYVCSRSYIVLFPVFEDAAEMLWNLVKYYDLYNYIYLKILLHIDVEFKWTYEDFFLKFSNSLFENNLFIFNYYYNKTDMAFLYIDLFSILNQI